MYSVASYQKGDLKGRIFTERILDLEAKIILYFCYHLRSSGVSALDQEAAFPSISRKFVFWILRKMGIHIGVINVLMALYSNCLGFLCLAGRLFDPILQGSGVKQGDPASMVCLFWHTTLYLVGSTFSFPIYIVVCLRCVMIWQFLLRTCRQRGAFY